MSTTAVSLVALTAAGLVLLLWVIGRAVTAAGNRIPPLRAYRSHDGAIMLADPALGGNAPCEPPITETRHARDQATHHDHSATEDK
jgi:hypothetical protein